MVNHRQWKIISIIMKHPFCILSLLILKSQLCYIYKYYWPSSIVGLSRFFCRNCLKLWQKELINKLAPTINYKKKGWTNFQGMKSAENEMAKFYLKL